MKLFTYEVSLHFKNIGWDIYIVNADCLENARLKAVKRVINEISYEYAEQIDLMKIYNGNKLLKEYSN